MFYGTMKLDEFLKTHGGQRHHRIVTPANYPYIYLLYREGRFAVENIDVDGDGTHNTVHFALEGVGDRAVENHADRKGVYHSLLLFEEEGGELTYIGEYRYSGTERDQRNNMSYFVLEKIEDLDRDTIYFLEKAEDNGRGIFSVLPTRKEFFNHIERRTFEGDMNPNAAFEEGDFFDDGFNKIELVPRPNPEQSTRLQKRIYQEYYILKCIHRQIRKKMLQDRGVSVPENIVGAYYYLVNTGCALTSFVVFQTLNSGCQTWCFDFGVGSKGDLKGGMSRAALLPGWRDNIRECLLHISNTYYGGQNFTFEKLFLSHPHADHFNEIINNMGFIDDKTELWINPYVPYSNDYTGMIFALASTITKYVEPIEQYAAITNGVIDVIHPKNSLRYKPNAGRNTYFLGKKDINNFSPLIRINVQDPQTLKIKRILFTGDIESKGWKLFAKDNTQYCTDAYVFSHHGSWNGSIFSGKSFRNYSNYINVNSAFFLPTRANVHPGIPCPCVTNGVTLPVYTTDTPGLRFYEYDLLKNICVSF